ncbi:hypothetical protein P12x_003205 [Tundrisphaera lichenicola]|uniref:hypothetical protein n=1 Tax=Tundrisphaera lichenicola TaxID=2029860 RepID=UPI003EB7A83D
MIALVGLWVSLTAGTGDAGVLYQVTDLGKNIGDTVVFDASGNLTKGSESLIRSQEGSYSIYNSIINEVVTDFGSISNRYAGLISLDGQSPTQIYPMPMVARWNSFVFSAVNKSGDVVGNQFYPWESNYTSTIPLIYTKADGVQMVRFPIEEYQYSIGRAYSLGS